MTPRFAIYYADGSIYEGGGADDVLTSVVIEVSRDWLAAPADRVLGVVVEQPKRQVLRATRKTAEICGTEFYYPLEDGEYGFADDLGAWLRKLGGTVKRGEYVASATMARFWAWAKAYERIPR